MSGAIDATDIDCVRLLYIGGAMPSTGTANVGVSVSVLTCDSVGVVVALLDMETPIFIPQ
jgi:hypothetical protein